MTDWIVVRNRLAMLGSRNKRLVGEVLADLSKRLAFRCIDGFAERVFYREFLPRGLTACEEVIWLLNTLHLPLSEKGRRRAAARAERYSAMDQPLQVDNVIG